MSSNAPLYLVDASIYVFRAYYSIPETFVSRDGQIVNAVYGYTQFLLDLMDRRPEWVSVAFDESLISCFRNEIYPEYKANRALPDENLKYQFKQCQLVTGLLGFHYLCMTDYEADDIIGSMLARFGEHRPAVIVTRDKDLGQLLRAGDRMWDFAADKWSDRDDIETRFGVAPELMPDLLALAGDAVDNIPGAPGIGAKTAARLLNDFGSLQQLLDNPDAVAAGDIRGGARLRDILIEHRERLDVYRRITGIKCDVPLQATPDDLTLTPADPAQIDEFCDAMKFGKRIRARMSALGST